MTTSSTGPYSSGWRRLLHPAVVMPVVAVLVIGVWWTFFRSSGSKSTRGAAAISDQVVDVTFGPIAQTVSAQGTIAAVATDALSFGASGTVTAVNVKAGDTVKAGQVLATLDSPTLVAAVDTAKASLAQAEAKLSDDTAAGASAAQLTADQAQVTTATDSLASAEAAAKGTSLAANFDGVVTSVNLVVGQVLGSSGAGGTSLTGSGTGSGSSNANVGAGTATNAQNRQQTGTSSTTSTGQINVQTTGIYKVDVPITSADISKVAVDQNATLAITTSTVSTQTFGGRQQQTTTTVAAAANTQSTATGATTKGKVTSVGAVASASTGVATFPVTVLFTGDPTKFYVGASVIATITVSSTADVLSVPTRAVTTAADGSSTVELSVDGSTTNTKVVSVTTGTSGGGQIEIRAGLKRGDKVVVPGLVITPTTSTTVRSGQGSTPQRNGG